MCIVFGRALYSETKNRTDVYRIRPVNKCPYFLGGLGELFHCVSECQDTSTMTDYRGTTAHTTSGRECQAWAQNYPHSHSYNTDILFPYETVSRAGNFCRNPFKYYGGGPWCYTMDPDVRWRHCDIEMCPSV